MWRIYPVRERLDPVKCAGKADHSHAVWFCDYQCSLIVLGRPTANVLSYYEPLNYDPSLLRSQHTRVARDESGRGTVRLHINAFNR